MKLKLCELHCTKNTHLILFRFQSGIEYSSLSSHLNFRFKDIWLVLADPSKVWEGHQQYQVYLPSPVNFTSRMSGGERGGSYWAAYWSLFQKLDFFRLSLKLLWEALYSQIDDGKIFRLLYADLFRLTQFVSAKVPLTRLTKMWFWHLAKQVSQEVENYAILMPSLWHFPPFFLRDSDSRKRPIFLADLGKVFYVKKHK